MCYNRPLRSGELPLRFLARSLHVLKVAAYPSCFPPLVPMVNTIYASVNDRSSPHLPCSEWSGPTPWRACHGKSGVLGEPEVYLNRPPPLNRRSLSCYRVKGVPRIRSNRRCSLQLYEARGYRQPRPIRCERDVTQGFLGAAFKDPVPGDFRDQPSKGTMNGDFVWKPPPTCPR